jgi:hypothetical protein
MPGRSEGAPIKRRVIVIGIYEDRFFKEPKRRRTLSLPLPIFYLSIYFYRPAGYNRKRPDVLRLSFTTKEVEHENQY